MNRHIQVYTIDSFSLEGADSTGNPAGFVVNENLTETEMRAIATAVGFSETAFVSPIIDTDSDADFKVRFFTPNEEVDLCGHATIGLFAGLYQLKQIAAGRYIQETKAGNLRVDVGSDGEIMMEQASPKMGECYAPELIAASLGLETGDIRTDLPCQAVYTGLLDLLIPVKNIETLERIQPDDEAITRISQAFGVVGYHVFAISESKPLETNNAKAALKPVKTAARCRNFAPLYAIPEEAATGTSNGALAAYLSAYGIAPETTPKVFEFIQGVEMGRPSQINAQIDTEGVVWVGGTACHLNVKSL